MKNIRPAVEEVLKKPGDLLDNAIRENVRLTVENLKTATPVINRYVAEKQSPRCGRYLQTRRWRG